MWFSLKYSFNITQVMLSTYYKIFQDINKILSNLSNFLKLLVTQTRLTRQLIIKLFLNTLISASMKVSKSK